LEPGKPVLSGFQLLESISQASRKQAGGKVRLSALRKLIEVLAVWAVLEVADELFCFPKVVWALPNSFQVSLLNTTNTTLETVSYA
jgi:hypothetical protein